MNRSQRRSKPRKPNRSKSDMGIRAQLVRETAIDIAVMRHLELFSWFIVIALNDTAGWGAKRIQRFLSVVEDLRKEWDCMRTEVDMDYANEKVRMRAEKVYGMPLGYVEDDILAARKRGKND